jgi:membrane-associated phospholipid phosphatase
MGTDRRLQGSRRQQPRALRAAELIRGQGAREAALLLAALALCPLAALAIGSDAAGPVARAEAVADLERSLGLFVEPAVHAWAAGAGWLLTAAGVFYVWAHVPVAGWALIWTWYLRRDAYPTLRNAFVATQVVVIAVYVLIPTAPPRLLPGAGFTDTLTGLWGRELADSAHLLQSPYAAMPSGHVAFALLAGGAFALLGDQRWLRVFGWLYPPVVVAVTIMTANHFWLDAVGGAAVAALSVGLVTVRPWLTSKRTSPAPCGRSSVPWATRSPRATPSSSSSR